MSERLSPQREAEIAARAEAATPGPWRLSEDYNDIHSSEGDHLASYWHTADGAFIAHAPEDINALAAELAAVRAEQDAACVAELRSIAADIASAVRPMGAGPRTEFERGLSVGARSLRLRADELETGATS